MAPVPAIADMVADPRRRSTRIVTPLERLRHPSQPGRTGSDSREEDRHGRRTPDRTESEAAKGIGPSTPGRGPGLEVMHPHAAGIDVGNSAHYVAVRPDRDPDPVRRFDCFTVDLHRLADWLEHC